jgi:hypothetical protein
MDSSTGVFVTAALNETDEEYVIDSIHPLAFDFIE